MRAALCIAAPTKLDGIHSVSNRRLRNHLRDCARATPVAADRRSTARPAAWAAHHLCPRLRSRAVSDLHRAASPLPAAARLPQKFFEDRRAVQQTFTSGMELGVPLHGEDIARPFQADR